MTVHPVDAATRRQQEAADPRQSTWLSANAGSGKTRVLTDRVARLLLDEVDPQKILCLTYTKAAASEMQNRLFRRLGAWAMLPDLELQESLRTLGVASELTPQRLAEARTLFARAIETPGGLKIQTIHSFCASLLRRFPLEAGVTPNFTEIEDRAAELLRAEIIDQMAEGPESELVVNLGKYYSGTDFLDITRDIVGMRDAFQKTVKRDDICEVFGIDPELTLEQLQAQKRSPDDAQLIERLIPVLEDGSSNDQGAATVLKTALQDGLPDLEVLESKMLYSKAPFSAKIGAFPTEPTRKKIDDLMPALNALMQRVEHARDARLAFATVARSEALHRLAAPFIEKYEAEKLRRGWLDFDDLISNTRRLLSDPAVAAWVLYRIDGGIDHILVDEAQDTSPAQWDVIARLAEEFASGEGSRSDVQRTIFVVGDQKQSIYSFQGADPREFNRMKKEFDTRLRASGKTLESSALAYSFRSSPAILELVDRIFYQASASGFGPDSGHIAFKSNLPGRVDLWPVVPSENDKGDRKWFEPVDRQSPRRHTTVLAEAIAAQICDMIENDRVPIEEIEGGGIAARPVRAGDIMILVQRRSGIFPELIKACKARNLPIAGADRLKVGAEMAVRDLAALLSFLATPEDSLSLATALRSPLFGWSEADLFKLAHGRSSEHLWADLRGKTEEYPETISVLKDLRSQTDYLRPFDLMERMLTRHDGRRKLLSRLGPEAEDGIDALLNQALAYERNSVPSLTGFLVWMETDDLEIKRQIDSASDQIRIMTVHGAKGLEAPIVILPDCGKRPTHNRDLVLQVDGVPIWKPNASDLPSVLRNVVAEKGADQRSEALRLLYVAMTRTEKWLIVAAAGDLSKSGDTWHQIIEQGVKDAAPEELETPVGKGLRLEHGDWHAMRTIDSPVTLEPADALEPHFSVKARSPAPRPATVSPSDLGGAKAMPGDGLDEETAKSYGAFVHALLDEGSDTSDRPGNTNLTDVLQDEAKREVGRLLALPELQRLFGPDVLSEVAVTCPLGDTRLHGTIDRLVVENDRIMIVDFKTNRAVPTTPQSCPEGILRQMGAYAHAVQEIFPGKQITTSVLWTRTGTLMELPNKLVTEALQRSGHLDAMFAPT